MNKGQTIMGTILSVILMMAGGGSIVKIYSDIAVNTRDIVINADDIKETKDRIALIENAYIETSKRQSFIEGKLDTILILNGINPKRIEKEIEEEIASTTLTLATTTAYGN